MNRHAKLSPSSAHRWLVCAGSVGLSQYVLDKVGEETSVYAEEGTKAHRIAELEARLHLGQITQRQYKSAMTRASKGIEEDSLQDMKKHALDYVDVLESLSAEMGPNTQVFLEQRLDTGVPGCWGTGDAVLLSRDAICVLDYKYGKGVVVNAEDNPQLKLYALGAMHTLADLVTDIEHIRMVVHQPRASQKYADHSLDAQDLRDWRDQVVIPQASRILAGGELEYVPDDTACRWCPALGWCEARMTQVTSRDFGDPDTMDLQALADSLAAAPGMQQWLDAVSKAALRRAYNLGEDIPGWKVVRSSGRRVVLNEIEAIRILEENGYLLEEISRLKVETLGKLDKIVGGKDRLQEILGSTLAYQEGRVGMVPEDDPRDPVTPNTQATKDFGEKQP